MANSAIDVQKAYLAYFGRPADPVGLAYWMGQDAASMRAGFAASTEYATLYSGMTAEQRVEQVYQNLFGRSADAAGKAYWVNALNAGTESVSSLVTSMQANAIGVDIGTIDNRVTYAIKFTAQLDTPSEVTGYNGTAAANAARSAVSEISYTTTSLNTATSTIVSDASNIIEGVSPAEAAAAATAAANDAAAQTSVTNSASYGTVNGAAASSATLTGSAANDTIVGGSANNTINGGGGADSLTGGTGDDTFQFASHADLAAATAVNGTSGTDNITITAAALDLVDSDFTNASNIDSVILTGASTITVGTAANTAMGGAVVVKTGAGATTVDGANSIAVTVDATSLADGVALTLTDSATSNMTVTNLIGDLTTTALAGTLNVTTGAVATLSVTTGDGTNAINANALTDGQVLTLTGNDNASVTLVAGDLTSTSTGNITVTATTGTNVITTAGGADNITGGTGADTINVGADAVADTINFAVGDSTTAASDQITNFTIANDILNLPTTTIAADVAAGAGNGTDSGAFKAHTITNGLIELFGNDDGVTGGVVTVNAGNLTAAITYIVTNITTAGNTVLLQYDASGAGGYGAGDAVLVFQDGATDTLVSLVGVDASALTKLGTAAAANTVVIS